MYDQVLRDAGYITTSYSLGRVDKMYQILVDKHASRIQVLKPSHSNEKKKEFDI
jgi:hypothetical protein